MLTWLACGLTELNSCTVAGECTANAANKFNAALLCYIIATPQWEVQHSSAGPSVAGGRVLSPDGCCAAPKLYSKPHATHSGVS